MIPIAIIKVIISILIGLRLIPKCQIMAKLEIAVLEDELKQLNKINNTKQETITSLRRAYKDMEKQCQAMFLLEQDGQALIKKQAAQLSKQVKQISAYEKDAEVAIEEFNTLQDDLATATNLSKRLKEALTKWTS